MNTADINNAKPAKPASKKKRRISREAKLVIAALDRLTAEVHMLGKTMMHIANNR